MLTKVKRAPGWLSGEEPTCQCRIRGFSIPGLGRSPGERNGNPLQYSCLENPMDRGAWWATVPGVTKELDVAERLNNRKIKNNICVDHNHHN